MIDKSLPASPRLFDPNDILGYLKEGSVQLWVAAQGSKIIGCWVSSRVEYPRNVKSLKLWIIGGSDLNQWAEPMRAAMTEHAKKIGASFLEGGGRKGWTRLYGRKHVWHDLGSILLMEI